MANLIVGGALIVLVALAVRHIYRNRKSGGCGCGCGGCAMDCGGKKAE